MKILLKFSLSNSFIDVDIIDKNNNTPLFIACMKNYENIIRLLLKKSDIGISNEYGNTCLHIVCRNNYINIFKLLMEYEHKIDFNKQNDNGDSDIFKSLILIYKIIIYKHFFYFAYKNNNECIVNLLLSNPNIDINKNDKDNNYENLKIDINIKNKTSNTCLHIACENNNINIINLLLSNKFIDIA